MDDTPKNIAGREIHRFRLMRNLTQEGLAASLQLHGFDISRTTLAKIEAGIRCVSDVEVVVFSRVLGCTPNDLLSRDFQDCLRLLRSSTR
jgi:transcriptional regulator with XRE-family HTH domain